MSNTSSLPTELRASIHAHHQTLNQLIISRLPLCLPPHTTTPHLYAAGISLFGTLYSTLESFHDRTLNPNPKIDRPSNPTTLKLLRLLKTTHLSRHARLQADLSLLRTTLSQATLSRIDALNLSCQPIYSTLYHTLESKPHLLLAWQWCLYLALFNGGRYIRRTLRNVPQAEFWCGGRSNNNNRSGPIEQEKEEETLPLTFWEFNGDQDGEDVKAEFTRRFEEASLLLTQDERRDVVDEAKRVFEVCESLVARLDLFAEEMAREEMQTEDEEGNVVKLGMKSRTTRWSNAGSMLAYVLVLTAVSGLWHFLLRMGGSLRQSTIPMVSAEELGPP